MQKKKRKISSNSRSSVIVLFLLFVVVPLIVFIFHNKATLWDTFLMSLPFCGITFLISLFYLPGDEVEYDGAFFYIYNCKKEPKNIIPFENISSMIWFRNTYRFYYYTKTGGKSYFSLRANIGFSHWQLEKELKKANACFFSVQTVFGFEHLIFRKEEWFK